MASPADIGRDRDGGDVAEIWQDALTAAAILAVDPIGIGGIAVRAGPGPVRDRWLALCRAGFPGNVPFPRMPAQIGDERLIGGLDLAATLRHGRPVQQAGLLVQADGGIVVMAMAERIGQATAAHLAAAMDCHEVRVERDGISARQPTSFGVIALDESAADDERLSPVIADRLAFHIDLTGIPFRCVESSEALDPSRLARARNLLATRNIADRDDEAIGALVSAAAALGINSLRAPFQALRAARALAALGGDSEPDESGLQRAARLVFAPRATQLPLPPQPEMETPPADAPEKNEPPPDRNDPPQPAQHDQDDAPADDEPAPATDKPLEDIILEAVAAMLPRDLLARLAEAAAPVSRNAKGAGRSGPAKRSRRRGRPIGVGPGDLGHGDRLSIVDTLRVAAPWQRIRTTSAAADVRPAIAAVSAEAPRPRRIAVRPEDFRFKRYAERSEALTIFIVDASGSTALHRLGEAKGAVELLLADCYIRRDSVALIALRGRQAELVLPPTRALTRAKRSLAGLPGGGGTPLASGIDEAIGVALAARRRDQQPTIVILTDGAANVARDGRTGRSAGQADAVAAGRNLVAYGLPTLLIDTGPRPSPFAAQLADAISGRYFALPMADAKALSAIVKSATAHG